MTRISNGDIRIIEEFVKDLESTSELVQNILTEVREGEVNFATIKTELKLLCEDVKKLSAIIRDGEHGISLLTRLAILEHKLSLLEKSVEKKDNDAKETQKSLAEIEVADTTGKWHMRATVATGVISLVASVIALLVGLLK